MPQIIDDNFALFIQEEEARAKSVIRLYEGFRLRFFDLLGSQKQDAMGFGLLASLGREVEKEIINFRKDLSYVFSKNLRKAVNISIDSVSSEIKTINQSITGKNINLNIRAGVVLSRSERLLVSQYDSSIARYGEELRGRISRVLSESAIKSETFDQVTKKLASTKGLIRTEAYKVERIARTEFNNAHNVGRLQTMEESKRVLPDLKKRWDAHLDKRTSDICKGLNGRVVEIKEDFEYQGDKFQAPPAHPNCRSVVIPFREAWSALF